MTKIEKILKVLGVIPAPGVSFFVDEYSYKLHTTFKPGIELGEKWYSVSDVKYDLNAIRELELLTIKKVGEQKFWCVAEDQSDNSMSGTYYSCRANLYTASCEKRINVIMEALGIND